MVLLAFAGNSHGQDKRTTETKVADLLAQFPANDLDYTDKLMGDMLALGETGINQVCNLIIPAGTGDDTRARFAVESLSRFLSQKGKEVEKAMWEKICIEFATRQTDAGVKDFFMKQLQTVGGEATVQALQPYLTDKDLCNPALAAIVKTGSGSVESVLAASLKNKELACPAAVMNALAEMKSALATSEFIAWATDADANTRASAYNALAKSGSPLALPVLTKAAADAAYRWEHTGATASLLEYAETMAEKGDLKTMDKICKLVISKCKDELTVQNKSRALNIYTKYHGLGAMKELQKAAASPDRIYRNAAYNSSMLIPDGEIVSRWISYFPKAIPDAKPEIIAMLGNRGDEAALPLVRASLGSADGKVRASAAAALAKMEGARSAGDIVNYLRASTSPDDQEAAKSAFMSIAGNREVDLLLPVLKDCSDAARKSIIDIIGWNKNNAHFDEVMSYTSYGNQEVKDAAYNALVGLSGPADQEKLIGLLNLTEDQKHVKNIQDAIASAAAQVEDPARRSAVILKALSAGAAKQKLIPVLAFTGGRDALDVVLKEFEGGNPEMRDICFRTLTSWQDYTSSSALYEICASGNKTFETQAFNAYVRQIRTAPVPDEQKLLLFRKIMPYALDPGRKSQIISQAGRLKTYQALYFVAEYLDDPATSSAAATAAMQIALPATGSTVGLYGTLVREILTKAVPKITGPESDYEKEMVNKYIQSMPADEGFRSMFNGKDLSGWQGLVENPIARAKMRKVDLARKQAEANVLVPANWSVKDGTIVFNGRGDNLCSVEEYGDFEMLVDWKITKGGDSGIYLRGSPQVQIWDTSRVEVGAQVGSGGLYNNQVHPSKPLKVADNPVGDWNTFRIIMIGEKVSVWLNGELVVDNVTMENYWDRKQPIFPKGYIELQAHGTDLAFRDIYVREIREQEINLSPEEKAEGYVSLFNGRDLDNWIGNKESYVAEDGMIVIKPESGSGGNLYTEKEYGDFIFRFEFLLTPAANNGLGIRTPLEGDAAYVGMELQILDNTADVYSKLQPYQYHGSVYGVIPAKRGYLKPVGEWNYEEVYVKGTRVKITLNGTVILDGDIADARDHGTMDKLDHPGLKNTRGHIAFLGHGSVVKFRNIRIKDLTQ